MIDAPLVTAVMITGKTPEHEQFAKVAVQCFLRQSYANRRLAIINDGDYSVHAEHPLIAEKRIPKGKTLGELRNVGLAMAEADGGEYAIQWDDDDYHHPHRIMFQMAHRQATDDDWVKAHAVVLGRQMRVNLIRGKAFNVGDKNGIAGTILHSVDKMFRYPAKAKSEDADFLKLFAGDVVIVDNDSEVWPGPALYMRLFHGRNTWDEDHFHGKGSATSGWNLNADEAAYMKKALEEYGVTSKVVIH